MKIATIIGARPQFIKAAAISRAIAAHNRLTPDSSRLYRIIEAVRVSKAPSEHPPLYGDGKAAAHCLKALQEW
jgi:hypothetical protein